LAVWESIIHSKSRHISTLTFIYSFITLAAKNCNRKKESIRLRGLGKGKTNKCLIQLNTSAKFKQTRTCVSTYMIYFSEKNLFFFITSWKKTQNNERKNKSE
jgi:hypothetical protein